MSIRSIKTAAALGLHIKSQNGKGEKIKEEKCEDFDDILDIIGSQGKYQKFLLYVILCPITAIEPVLALNILFMLYESDHWCSVPGRPDNITSEAWKNLTIPREADGTLSQCEMYESITGGGFNRSRISCNAGWEYDTSDYSLTIPSQYNWVCDRGQWATISLTVASVGNACGTIFYGIAADKIGRRPIFFLCLFLNVFGRIISLFTVSNFYLFLTLQFITGTGFPMIFVAPCMLCAEMSDRVFRAWIYSATWMIWVVGMASLPLIAWLCRDWFLIGMITSAPMIFAFLYYKWVPESPRWLISVGRIQEAAVIIRKIAVENGTSDKITDTQLDSMLKLLVIKQDQSDQRVGIWTLFTRRRLAKNTIMVTIAWIMNAVIYYAITLNASNLSANQFVAFFLLAIIELPSGYLGSVLVDKMGRRWTQVAFFILCTIASITSGIASSYKDSFEWSIVSVVSAVIAKFAITLTFLVVYLQATEIFPTQLRSTGSGFASTMGSIIGIFTPYIVYTSKFNMGAPWFVIGAMSIVGVISSAFLPETLNQALPETLEDANNFGNSTKFWSFIPNNPSLTTAGNEKNQA